MRFVQDLWLTETLAAATIGPPPLMSLDFPQSLALCRETLCERVKAMESIQSAMTGQTALRTPLTSVKSPEARQRLFADPLLAEQQARQMLAQKPRETAPALLLAAALRIGGRPAEARDTLATFVERQPQLAAVWFEFGLALGDNGEADAALAAHYRAVDLNSSDPEYWYGMVSQWTKVHDGSTMSDSRLAPAANALAGDRLDEAERLLGEALNARGDYPPALKLLADTLLRQNRYQEAEPLLARCLEIDPDFHAARFRYAAELFSRNGFAQALPHAERLLEWKPEETVFRFIQATALSRCWRFEEALRKFENLLGDEPGFPGRWLAYALALRAVGRKTDASNALVKATEVLPEFGEAYRTLATIKSFRFTPPLIELLRKQLQRPGLFAQDRADLQYALGKALEDNRSYEASFESYQAYNDIMRAGSPYESGKHTQFVRDSKMALTTAFLASRTADGDPASEPIFMVGMPRSGSTLTEQILASHSAIEGAGELPFLDGIATKLKHQLNGRYPERLDTLGPDQLKQLGKEYLALSRRRLRLGRPFFIDKHNANFHHLGLIHLILPNARIIDTRRHPLDCGLSCFKTYLHHGTSFPHRLAELGRYYSEYVELMAHYDDVLPGKIYRVIYEQLVADPESQVRLLLDFLGLPFEEQCLRFHEQERVVLTPSAEQIRQPIYSGSMEYWRNYEPWLGPLKEALGPVLNAYPEVPKFLPPAPIATTISASATFAPGMRVGLGSGYVLGRGFAHRQGN